MMTSYKIVRKLILSTLLLACFFQCVSTLKYYDEESKTVETETLSVKTITENGFGVENNLYAFSMETFKGNLFVSTMNLRFNFFELFLFFMSLPLWFSDGAEVFKGTRNANDGDWTMEKVLEKGLSTEMNFGIRKLRAVGDCMYAVTVNHNTNFEVLRTYDGTEWASVSEPGFGEPGNTSGRGLVDFKGHLYVGTENRYRGGAQIWRHALDDESGDLTKDGVWELVASGGIDTSFNVWFSDFAEFHDYLYVGTNNLLGAELYRSSDGVTWERLFCRGNGARLNISIMKLYVYQDRLYLGTMNFLQGASLLVSRADSDTDFSSVFTKGNGYWRNVYMWYIIEYENRLYVGTFNQMLTTFMLFSAEDPLNDEFVLETDNAFCSKIGYYGIRSMVVFEDKLMIGSAGWEPFKVFEATSLSSNTTSLQT